MTIEIIRAPIDRTRLSEIAASQFGDMGNRSRGVEDQLLRDAIRGVVAELVRGPVP